MVPLVDVKSAALMRSHHRRRKTREKKEENESFIRDWKFGVTILWNFLEVPSGGSFVKVEPDFTDFVATFDDLDSLIID